MRNTYVLLAVLVLSSPALGTTRDQCLSRVDALHACACNDIRGNEPQDLGAFRLDRPDIQAAYQTFKSSPHYNADADSALVNALKTAYDQQRDLLACHDRVGLKMGKFIMAQEYCLHEPDAAYNQGKAVCDNVDQETITQATNVVTERANKLLGTLEQELSRLSFCRVDSLQALKNTRAVAVEYPPCKIDLKSLFPNNISKLTPAQVKKIVAYVQGHSCYQQYLRNGLTLQKVEIRSSSSLLANTGEAANKSFMTLSQERADEIEHQIVQSVFDPGLLARIVYDKNARGQNGDGTTGECPYAYDDRRETWIRKAFPTNEQLEGNKHTELNFYFGDRVKHVVSNLHSDLMTVPCQQVQFYCR